MTVRKIFVLGLAIFLFSGWGLEGADAQTSRTGQAFQADPELCALMLRNGKIILSSAPQPEAAQELTPGKTPASDDLTLTGKMLKGKAAPPAKKEKPYPAPEVKKPGAKDTPYPAPEIKKPAEPKKPAVTAPVPPTPPAKTAPAAPVILPAPATGGI